MRKKKTITINAISTCSKVQTSLGGTILKDLTPDKVKTILTKSMIDSYLHFCFKWEVYTSLDRVSNLECGALDFFC